MYRALIITLLFLVSCYPVPETASTLSNQGILALSGTNPYLGSNLLISKEAEKSSYFFNFLVGRGAPVGLEVRSNTLRSESLHLYYPKELEFYIAELDTHTKPPEWIVRGPYAINREQYRELNRMKESMDVEPVFMIWGKPYRFSAKHDHPKVKVLQAPPLPTPKPTIKPRVKPKPQTGETAESSAPTQVINPLEFKPLNTDQQAIAISKGFAERADNGDLIHTVKLENETIERIAKWYTGTDHNGKELITTNGLSEDPLLLPGQRIRVPLKLIKQLKSMPSEFK